MKPHTYNSHTCLTSKITMKGWSRWPAMCCVSIPVLHLLSHGRHEHYRNSIVFRKQLLPTTKPCSLIPTYHRHGSIAVDYTFCNRNSTKPCEAHNEPLSLPPIMRVHGPIAALPYSILSG